MAYEKNRTKVLSYIGLATKAGKLLSGEFLTEKTVKEGKAKLVIVAEDSSDNTKKMFTNMCTYYKVPIYFFGEKTELGHAIGKEFRASLVLTDKGLADMVEKQLNINNDDTCEKLQTNSDDMSHN
ncbi:ribosomal L7Ae/L30e/S12e/Gadd45 family protein [Anaerocolumna sp. AGMB13020]|uniref:L7Ae/L30e/S12e/Gadd45 family ribosomal protein n=1 Tax=Anaerocolumna sp. AGMB13020 TaxID=3081750 RepID=UPI00295304F7|nr:ribosomal L7Ae/L30e/S12e/Gadd45 family protein [Anaerocolumna sp. AGMB13020]WOO36618.1 ribosomal L7Ae/L30e/S12e/Gadd45 family protein [Anaerocolumna sp. AGMB13020]